MRNTIPHYQFQDLPILKEIIKDSRKHRQELSGIKFKEKLFKNVCPRKW